MRPIQFPAALVFSISAVTAGCGDGTPPRPAEGQAAPSEGSISPYAGVTDPALLADPDAMRAAFGLPGDNSPLAFSLLAPPATSKKQQAASNLNATCPSIERVSWHETTVSPGADITWATATSCDAVYEVGYSSKALNNPLAPGMLLPWAGQNDLYVIKRDINGKVQWAKELGTASADFGTAVVATNCADPFIYVAGHSNGSFGGPSAGNSDVILLKLTADGTEVWRRQFGSTQNEQAWSIGLDAEENVFVTGQTFGNLPGSGVTFPSGTTSLFVLKYDPDGNRLWTRQVGVNNRTTVARGLAINPTLGGAIYVTGFTSAGFDGQPFAGGSYDAFIVKFDGAGNRLTAATKLIGTPALDQGYGIIIDGFNPNLADVYVTGYTNGVLLGQTNTGLNTYDAFVRRLDADLNEVWTDQVGGSTSVVANAGKVIAFGAEGVTVAVSTDRTVDGSDLDLGSVDIALVSYGPNGERSVLDYIGTPASEAAQGLANDATGNLFVGARTDGSFCGHAFGGGGVDGLLFRYIHGCLVNAPDSSCKVGGGSGDPHFVTMDNVRFDNQAAGHFVLTQGGGLDVQIRQCPGNSRVSLINAIGMKVGFDRVEYNAKDELYVNGELTHLTSVTALPGGGTVYPAVRGGLVFAAPGGGRVIARAFSNTWMNVTVVVPAQFEGLDGFLGNADGDTTNEFAMSADGTDRRSSLTFFDMYKAQPNFSDLWRVHSVDDRFIEHGIDCTDDTFPHQPASLQDLTPAQRTTGEAACAGLADVTAREACILDVGLTGDPVLADAALDNAAQLANQGVVAPAVSTATTVYFNDFSGAMGPEWDSIVTGTTPLGDRVFFGPFANETVRLTLNSLAPHSQLTVSFDLYVINGWDGDGAFGPNDWRAVADGQEVANYTFSNTFSTQSFPAFGSAAQTGALEVNTLFYPFGDAVYHITLTIPHSSSTLALDLSAEGLSGIFSEAWAMSNFEVQGRH